MSKRQPTVTDMLFRQLENAPRPLPYSERPKLAARWSCTCGLYGISLLQTLEVDHEAADSKRAVERRCKNPRDLRIEVVGPTDEDTPIGYWGDTTAPAVLLSEVNDHG